MIKKFRAWDNKRGEWFGESNPDCLTFIGFHIFGECLTFCEPSIEQLKHLDVEQFTGLLDKNGKDIWEGDIVTVKMIYKGGSLPHMGEIVYVEEFGAFATKNEAGETLLHNHLLNTFEVVGNIHENPRLMG